MKRSLIGVCFVGVLTFGLIWFLNTVKAHGEDYQERRNQEIEEQINGMREECRFQFPHSIVERAKCYQKMMATV